MKRLTLLLVLLFATVAHGQTITLGDRVPASAVDAARKTLQDATPKILILNVGEFEVIEPAKALTSPLLWLPINEELVQRIEIAPNQPFAIWMTRRGEKAPRLHIFTAQPVAWCLLVGVKDGKSSIFVIRNGDAQTPPQVADRLDVTVGKAPPGPIIPPDDPVIPVDDELTKRLRAAAQLDVTAGKADKRHLLPLAGIYQAASNDTLAQVATMDALDTLLFEARKRAGIPEPEVAYWNLRKAIQQEIYARLGIGPNDGKVPLTDDTKRLARLAFGKIANTLEVLAK